MIHATSVGVRGVQNTHGARVDRVRRVRGVRQHDLVPDAVAAKLTSQQLAGPPATSVTEVVGRLLAVQAQDPKGARLAVRARSTGLTARDVDDALARREVVVSWLNRGTLHLVRSEDWWWLHRLTTPQLATAVATRLRQTGVSLEQADRGVEVVREALADGPLHRTVLRERLQDKGIPTVGQAFVHVMFKATVEGVCLRSSDHVFADAVAWLGPPPPFDKQDALRWLGERYLAGHAPATPQDLVKWAGITLTDARTALAGRDVEVHAEPLPGPRLLGPFEPVLLGWADRSDVCPQTDGVVTTNGVFHPAILEGGRVVGTWSVATGELRPFRPLSSATAAALAEDLVDVRRFFA